MSEIEFADTSGMFQHPSLMTDAAVVTELNKACNSTSGKTGWNLQPNARTDGSVEFWVGGNVLPFRPDGQRYQRGAVPFYGTHFRDVRRALRSGLAAMRQAQESKR